MAIDWQKLPDMISGLPYDGDQVLLAVQNPISSGNLDFDFPYSLHLGRWDDAQGEWATNEGYDESSGIFWLRSQAPTFWAKIKRPL